ncbi:hypothetical protein ANCCEY_03002 [Ancylostoma ceylanicum]|uniref:Reverse transcriptase domain-containing protein n=1 Tax=Ancylostoma ceylanicum TaxID=53326 RepID=A0A0D6M355_9BILA|nr:hypothetical protein ANCCEY_03002 [Ancylostoma ceylanicum]
MLARVFTRYLLECKVPSQWKTSRIVLLYKKGNQQDISNYRPICLLILPFYDDITIDVRRGVRQGDTVSPKLFTAILEDVMRRLERDKMVLRVDNRLLQHLRFDDDLSGAYAGRLRRRVWKDRSPTEFNEDDVYEERMGPGCLILAQRNDHLRILQLRRGVNMMNDVAPELGKRKRAAWGA